MIPAFPMPYALYSMLLRSKGMAMLSPSSGTGWLQGYQAAAFIQGCAPRLA